MCERESTFRVKYLTGDEGCCEKKMPMVLKLNGNYTFIIKVVYTNRFMLIILIPHFGVYS